MLSRSMYAFFVAIGNWNVLGFSEEIEESIATETIHNQEDMWRRLRERSKQCF